MHAADRPPDEASSRNETQRLIRGAKAGDVDRFSELYERIAPALYAWASLRIRPTMRSCVDPEDVVQEVWCRAWKGFAEFEPGEGELRPWVFRIAKNVLLEVFRKLQHTSRGVAAIGPSTRLFQLQNLPDSATNISRRLSRDETIQALLHWVETLEEDERKLFVHCGLEGLTYAEAAERLGTNREVIAKRWQSLRPRVAQFGLSRDFVPD